MEHGSSMERRVRESRPSSEAFANRLRSAGGRVYAGPVKKASERAAKEMIGVQ
jgi:hypothetical protein